MKYIRPLPLFLLWSILLAVPSLRANVQDFITLDWTEFLSKEYTPTYETIYNIGKDINKEGYSVQIFYPEFTALTQAETKHIKKWNLKNITDSIVINQQLGVSRKNGILDISFVPIIRKKKTLYKLESFKLVVKPIEAKKQKSTSLKYSKETTNTTESSPYAQHSVLANGRWAKIAVSKEGVYQLTSTFLSSLGFKNPERVKLYGYGGLVQDSVINYSGNTPDYDDLKEVPLYRTTSGKLLFYANGVTRWRFTQGKWRHINNPYSSLSYYFITEGDNPAKFTTQKVESTNQATRNTVMGHALYEEDAYSWYSGGQQFYDSYDFAYGNSKTYSLKTPNVTSSTAYVTIVFSASDNSATNVSVSLNNKSLGSFSIPLLNNTDNGETGYKAKVVEKTFATTNLNSENNSFKFTTTAGHAARLDYIRITYPQTLNLTDTYLNFSDPNKSGSGYYSIQSADDNTRIWRLGTSQRDVQEIQGVLENGSYNVALPDVTDNYVAVNTNATFPTPSFIEQINNQDLHSDQNYDMVIIVPESGKLTEQAERLAAFHASHDSLQVKIVNAAQIYNEFSSGTPDAMAYRRYMKMLYDRAGNNYNNLPKYLILFGDAAWDNRMILSQWKAYNPKDYLLCYESWNSINEIDCYVTDDYFGYLDDGEGKNITSDKIDLAIGRFPVSTAADAKVMVDKIIQYGNNKNTGAWKNRICIMGDDDNDNNSLMADAEEIATRIESKQPSYLIKRVYWDAYDRVSSATGNTYPKITEELQNLMKQGVLIMNYTGHGSPSQISHEKVLTLSDFQDNKTDKLPLWISASCEIAPFDSQESTIGESAVLNPNGGAIAFMSATRSVYSTRNKYLNKFYMDYVLDSDENGKRYSIGEALLKTKIALVSSLSGSDRYMTDKTINKLKYNILGDPAIVLTTPNNNIVVDSINGAPLNNGENVALAAGSIVQINGHIENVSGNALDSFNGTVTISVYDRKESITCKNNANTKISPFTFYDRSKKLFEGTASVKNGIFSFQFPLTLDASYSESTGLMSLYAVSEDDSTEAHGASEQFYINSSVIPENDTIGPKIYGYLNNPEFKDGGTVNTTPYFVAQIEDASGINATGSGIGHDLELTIDGNASTSYILNDYFTTDFGTYKKGTVRYSLPELSVGQHRLSFRAWDMQNNSSTAILNFRVSKQDNPHILNIYCSENPATTQTTFTIAYDRPNANIKFHLDVFDSYGQQVWKKVINGQSSDGYYPISWDLTNSSGIPLPGGVYLYKVSIQSENGGKISSKTKKLIILNNK